MKQNIDYMVAPNMEPAYDKVEIERQNQQRPLGKTKDKLWNFIESPDPGFFQNGIKVIKMKRMQDRVSINQKDQRG